MSTNKDDKWENLIKTLERALDDLNKVVCIHNTLHNYPMAISAIALREWEQKMIAIQLSVKGIIDLLNYWDHDHVVSIIYDQFKAFDCNLTECILGCRSLAVLNENLQWFKYFKHMEQVSKLHDFSEIHRLQYYIVQNRLCLDSKLYFTSAMDVVSEWLKPGLLWPTPMCITLKTCCLIPNHDVFSQAKQPSKDQQVLRPTIFLFPDGVGIWHL